MRPNETTGELLARITNTMEIIKESYAAYDNKVLEPPTDAHGLGQVGHLENSLYNSAIFCVPKKQGQGLRIVQDFRELNQNSHIDKYSMKEITECIGSICRANSSIFTTLDLTSGFWQMQLDEDS